MPDEAVSVCHNDVLAGDVYVNHGILLVAMRSRGRFVCRMVRNPLHLFTSGRDAVRFAGRTHDVVVNLTEIERQSLRRTYPRVRPTAIVVGNGVDIERFRPPAPSERATARDALGLTDEMVVSLFIGHEYDRKGLYPLMEAVAKASARHHLVVVGGTASMVERLRARGHSLGVTDRLHIVGQASDPRPYLHAAEVLVSPSAYESYGLVVLEALACGVPVIATPVGCVPEVIEDGVNGFVTTGAGTDIAAHLARLAGADRLTMAAAARAAAEQRSWSDVASQYLDTLAAIRSIRVSGNLR
jgi:UDP-glucose:(heptosyl)LPS alpha-1,3-glucosyltransferase